MSYSLPYMQKTKFNVSHMHLFLSCSPLEKVGLAKLGGVESGEMTEKVKQRVNLVSVNLTSLHQFI